MLAQQKQDDYSYLQQSINLKQPQDHYVIDPIGFDQQFEAAKMLTPDALNQPWFNIYQQASGDWEYDGATASFWQRALVPYGNPYWNKGTDNPESVAIFTEFVSKQLPYTIVVEMTLYNVIYPFFAGIMFNKARWISGDPERITQYRLLGMYGVTDSLNNKSISFDFAEQKIIPKGINDSSAEIFLRP